MAIGLFLKSELKKNVRPRMAIKQREYYNSPKSE